MSFQNAQNVDASHSTFNDVQGTQMNIVISNTAVLQLTGTIVNHLQEVDDAPKERLRLLVEVSALQPLLTLLRNRIEKANASDPWLSAVQALGVENGPLDQFRSDLEQLVSKLGPEDETIAWKFDKAEVDDILHKIERIKTYINLAITDDLFTLSQIIKEDVSAIRTYQNDQEVRTVAKWISPLDFMAIQADIFQRREEGTGEWFTEHPDFKGWRDGKSGKIWCPGIPGAGKTVLASMVVNRLRILFGRRVAIACIFCNYKEQDAQTATNLIAALLKQIVEDQSAISDNVNSLYHRHIDTKTRPTLDEFAKTLQLELATYSKAFIIVDALDECREDSKTREKLLQSPPDTANLMVTSRDHLPAIAKLFLGAKRLDICANSWDVQKYIESRIHEGRLARLVHGDLDLQKLIVDKVSGNVKGMFLLARLHMDSLISKSSRREVRKALETLPREVNDTYDEAMKRIEAQVEGDRILAKRILSWIAYAYRPLSLQELQHALAVEPGMIEMDSDAIVDEDVLASVCAGLIIFQAREVRHIYSSRQATYIRLVHYTTQEYFENTRESRFPDAQASITRTCLTYLSFDVFGKGYNTRDLEPLLEEYALLDYAAQFWGHHVRGEVEKTDEDMILKFLHDGSKFPCACDVLQRYPGGYWPPPSNFSAVHACSLFGMAYIMEHQLEGGAEADSKDVHDKTPLLYAASYGHEAIVKLLLARDDVDVNTECDDFGTALSCAASHGHEAIIKLLLARDDIDVNAQAERTGTPLSYAARNGDEAIVKLLLAQDDVDVNAKDDKCRTPLSRAARNGYEAVVQLLLTRDDLDVNTKDVYGRTPVLDAAVYGHEAVVQALLARPDLDVGWMDKSGRTPLWWATKMGHETIVKLLQLRLATQPTCSKRRTSHSPPTTTRKKIRTGYDAAMRS